MDVREMLEKLGTRAFTLLLCFSSFKGRQELDDVHLLNMPHTLKHALSITYERILFQPAQTLFGALVLGVQLFVERHTRYPAIGAHPQLYSHDTAACAILCIQQAAALAAGDARDSQYRRPSMACARVAE